MFRTSHVHRQEDCIVRAALYGMFSMHLCKQSCRLEDVLNTVNQLIALPQLMFQFSSSCL